MEALPIADDERVTEAMEPEILDSDFVLDDDQPLVMPEASDLRDFERAQGSLRGSEKKGTATGQVSIFPWLAGFGRCQSPFFHECGYRPAAGSHTVILQFQPVPARFLRRPASLVFSCRIGAADGLNWKEKPPMNREAGSS